MRESDSAVDSASVSMLRNLIYLKSRVRGQ